MDGFWDPTNRKDSPASPLQLNSLPVDRFCFQANPGRLGDTRNWVPREFSRHSLGCSGSRRLSFLSGGGQVVAPRPLSTMVDPPARHLLDSVVASHFLFHGDWRPESRGDPTCRLVSWDSLTCNCWKDPAACRRITCQESQNLDTNRLSNLPEVTSRSPTNPPHRLIGRVSDREDWKVDRFSPRGGWRQRSPKTFLTGTP